MRNALIYLMFLGVMTFMLLEVGVRIFLPQPIPMLWMERDDRYGHRLKAEYFQRYPFPGSDFVMTVETNGQGLRDEAVQPRVEGEKTVLFIGDSFTFGHGVNVEERFDTHFRATAEAAGKEVRTINAGVSAWGTLQATRFVLDHLEMLEPDMVVLTFCENDPHDDTYFLERGVSFDKVRFPGKEFLRGNCHLFRFAQHQYLLYLKRKHLMAEAEKKEQPEGAVQKEAAAPTPQNEQELYQQSIPPVLWQRTEGYLREFMTTLRKQNPEAVLYIQATRPGWEHLREPLKMLEDIAGVQYVDLEPHVSDLDDAARRLPYDGHWSREMHKRSGKALFETLAETL